MPPETPHTTFTGPEGTFFFSVVRTSTANLCVSAPGFTSVVKELASSADQDAIEEITLESPDTAVRTLRFESGPKPSGWGANWSPFYELCSGKISATDEIVGVRFTLGGDRTCSGWAECRETSRTPTQACWQFRMQGHSERAFFQAGAVGMSQATLEIAVRDRPSPPGSGGVNSGLVFLVPAANLPQAEVIALIQKLRLRGYQVIPSCSPPAGGASAGTGTFAKVFRTEDMAVANVLGQYIGTLGYATAKAYLETTEQHTPPGSIQLWVEPLRR
jgi:hypothetical protein